MASNILTTRIGLKRAKDSEYLATMVPLLGELLFVDTSEGLKYKVGDGVTSYANLAYSQTESDIITCYKNDDKFYIDNTYTEEVEKLQDKIYIDLNFKCIYIYDGLAFKGIDSMISIASESKPGLVKMYSSSGENEDGTMTQKAITKGINDVSFSLNETDKECLILKKPW